MFLSSFLSAKTGVPIQFKVSVTGGILNNSIYFNDPLESPWKLPLNAIEEKQIMDAYKAEKIAKNSDAFKVSAQVEADNKKSKGTSSYIDNKTGEEFTKYSQNSPFYAGFLEAQIRYNSIILGCSFGGSYDFAQPVFKKIIEIPTMAERLSQVGYAHTNSSDSESRDKLKEQQDILSEINNKLPKNEKANVNSIIVEDSIKAINGWAIMAGPYIGYYLNDSFSIKVFAYLTLKNTKIETITNEIRKPEETLEMAKTQAKIESKGTLGFLRRFWSNKKIISQEVNKESKDIIAVKTHSQIGWMPGIMTGLTFAYSLNDYIEVWLMGAVTLFFDNLYNNVGKDILKDAQKKLPLNTTADQDNKEQKDNSITDSQHKQLKAINGPKYCFAIGISFSLN
jgi:hypothetical protein